MLLEDGLPTMETEFVGTQQIPTLKARQVIKLLENLGFVEIKQRGSHKQFRHADGRGQLFQCIKVGIFRQYYSGR